MGVKEYRDRLETGASDCRVSELGAAGHGPSGPPNPARRRTWKGTAGLQTGIAAAGRETPQPQRSAHPPSPGCCRADSLHRGPHGRRTWVEPADLALQTQHPSRHRHRRPERIRRAESQPHQRRELAVTWRASSWSCHRDGRLRCLETQAIVNNCLQIDAGTRTGRWSGPAWSGAEVVGGIS